MEVWTAPPNVVYGFNGKQCDPDEFQPVQPTALDAFRRVVSGFHFRIHSVATKIELCEDSAKTCSTFETNWDGGRSSNVRSSVAEELKGESRYSQLSFIVYCRYVIARRFLLSYPIDICCHQLRLSGWYRYLSWGSDFYIPATIPSNTNLFTCKQAVMTNSSLQYGSPCLENVLILRRWVWRQRMYTKLWLWRRSWRRMILSYDAIFGRRQLMTAVIVWMGPSDL